MVSSFVRNTVLATAVSTVAAVAATEVIARLREESIEGQVALVTGGSRGLGLLVARELGRNGCRVAICARHEDALARAAEQLRSEGIEVHAQACDVRNLDSVEALVRDVSARFGRIDILVNNAGIIQVAPVADTSVADFEDAVATIFWGTLYPTLAVLPEMRRRKAGRIVNVTSIGGKVSVPHLLPYNAGKFATVGLSEGLHAELARDGITVTTVVPGLMRTGSYLNALFGGAQKREFAWFAVAANAPLLTVDAERAARRIVAGTRRREAEVVVGLPALVLGRFHGVFPGLTTEILGIVNRFLPGPEGEGSGNLLRRSVDRKPGGQVERFGSGIGARAFDLATTLGRSSARRYNEVDAPDPT